MKIRRYMPFLLMLALMLFVCVNADAQCAMCKATSEKSVYAKSLNEGIMYLLLAPVVILGTVLIIDALCGHKIQMQNLSEADDTVFMKEILHSKAKVLDAGAGGTTFRFLTAYLATQEGREVVLTGSERMQQRPIKILVDALRS